MWLSNVVNSLLWAMRPYKLRKNVEFNKLYAYDVIGYKQKHV